MTARDKDKKGELEIGFLSVLLKVTFTICDTKWWQFG